VAYILIVLFIALVALLISYYEYWGIGPQKGIVRRIPKKKGKYVALTFDDGPSKEYTPAILEILKSRDVKASFFVTGKMVERYPDIVKRMADEGHDIGNHTYDHFNLILLSNSRVEEQIEKGEDAIKSITGIKPALFRPPRCLMNKRIRTMILTKGYQIVLWSVSAADWGPLKARGIAFRVCHFVRPGRIILLHDGGSLVGSEGGDRSDTVNALPVILDRLIEKGYKIVPASELIRLAETADEISCLDQAS
jgi:peptidoglycan/xylan/chitin deacetylase (PgdA/CDA1 family)